jgi:hypothetical protein
MTIQPGWLERFRSDPARSFLRASFGAWCLTKIGTSVVQPAAPGEREEKSPKGSVAAPNDGSPATGETSVTSTAPIVLAQLSTSDPLILESRYGNGIVLVMTSTLDRKWNDLPTRSDFVPFLHEAVFHAASARSHRNVSFAEPLIARIAAASKSGAGEPDQGADDEETVEFVFTTPGDVPTPVVPTTDSQALTAVMTNTFAPGIYRMKAMQTGAEVANDSFVVNYDHSEDNPDPLTDDDKARLATNDRVRFSGSLDDLTRRMYGQESTTELWAALLTLFLLFLVGELLLTRRTILKGYGGESLTAA